MALKLDILANTTKFVSEAKKAGASIEDISDALDDMAKEGDDAGEKLERSFREAVKEVKKLDDAAKEAERGIDKSFKQAGKDVEKFGDKAKDELRDSAREGAQSFSGEFTDVQDVLQETVANLGPAGIAGAALIGAVVATATAAVEAWNEKIDGIKEATADMWAEAASEGQRFLDGEAIRAEADRIIWDDTFKAQFEAAEKAGVERSDLAIALAEGEGETFDKVLAQFQAAKDAEVEVARKAADQVAAAGLEAFEAETDLGRQIGETITILDEKAKATDVAKDKAKVSAAVATTLNEQERQQLEKTREAARKLQEDKQKLTIPTNAPVRLTVDDSAIRRYVPPTIYVKVRGVDERGRFLF